jgi:hypothetical protein
MVQLTNNISRLTEESSNEEDVDKKIEILYRINSILPISFQITISSLLDEPGFRSFRELFGIQVAENSLSCQC